MATAKKERVQEPMQVAVMSSNPDKNIPKFCTSVNFGVLPNNNLILTFTYNEGEKQPHVLIERIIVDVEHAKKISDVLKNVLDQIEKGGK